MKNFLKTVMIICLVFAFTSMQAQVKFGAKVGLNMSTMSLKSSGISIDPKTLVGFNIGAISEISLGGSLFIQPGVFYSGKGTKYKIGTEEGTFSPQYLEVPVNVGYYFGTGKTKFSVFAGPYFAFGIGGKIKSGGESVDIKFGTTDNDDMKPMDFGLNLGAGVNLSNFLISAQYAIGLSNLYPVSADDVTMKMKVISISVGYLFGK
jgi:hypothetical protein